MTTARMSARAHSHGHLTSNTCANDVTGQDNITKDWLRQVSVVDFRGISCQFFPAQIEQYC